MKRLLTSSLILLLIVSSVDVHAVKASKNKPPFKLRIVKIKPIRRYTNVYQPMIIKKGHVWRQGYWQWNKLSLNYDWVRAHSVRKKNNKTWTNGHWSKVKGGWIYHQGFWA